MAASYILLVPHFVGGSLLPAGTLVTEGSQIPVGWIPTLACDPQDSTAIQNYWNAGPQSGAEPNRDFYPWVPVKSTTYWTPVPGTQGYWQLTGAGTSLGSKNAPTPPALLGYITLSNQIMSDTATIGSVVGTLGVSFGTGTYTFALTTNPGSRYAISGNQLVTAATLVAGTDIIAVQANNGAGSVLNSTFSIVVSHVVVLPSAPVLILVSATSTATFTVDVDNTISAGDSLEAFGTGTDTGVCDIDCNIHG
jgi:hypothetical protein